MASPHDRTSTSLAPASTMRRPDVPAETRSLAGLPLLCQESGTDPLSDVLRTVRLTGALFHLVQASFPWGVEIPRASAYASILLPRAQHVVSYHIILQGSGWVTMPGDAPMPFEAGDVLVLAHGEPYSLLSSPGQRPEFDAGATIEFFREMVGGKLPFVTREGGGGEGGAEYICGFLGCDMRPFNPVLSTLPRLLQIKWRGTGRENLLSRLIDLTLAEVRLPRAGGESVRLRLSELIFVEVVRQCLETLPADQTGWLAALRDPAIGKVLAALHERPAHSWTLREMTQLAGMSRAALAARFALLVGYPPMQYLKLWRIQIAARLLADGSAKVASVGREVGYASEAAFSRAFKKAVGESPAAWRGNPAGNFLCVGDVDIIE